MGGPRPGLYVLHQEEGLTWYIAEGQRLWNTQRCVRSRKRPKTRRFDFELPGKRLIVPFDKPLTVAVEKPAGGIDASSSERSHAERTDLVPKRFLEGLFEKMKTVCHGELVDRWFLSWKKWQSAQGAQNDGSSLVCM